MSIPRTSCPAWRIHLGTDSTGAFDAGLPVLAGAAVEDLFGDALPTGRAGAFTLFQAEGWLLGAATVPISAGLEEVSRRLYENMFTVSRGWHLARIWNYVPAINDSGSAGLENYRVFCQGRSRAFKQAFGRGFHARLPAASAVGSLSTALTVVFAAGLGQPSHVENPLQVAAYHYPGEYGPRAPSFARATVMPGTTHATVFISGTAAIRGHATVAPDNLDGQLECTVENLRAIAHACGLGPEVHRDRGSTRHFKVYLRDAADLPRVTETLAESLLAPDDSVSYLRSDLCRAALRVEIEASIFGVS